MGTLHHLIAFAASNQIFSGMAAAGGFASAVYWLREIPARALGSLLWLCSNEIEVANDSSAFEPFVRWLERHGTSWHARHFTLSTDSTDCDGDEGAHNRWTVAPGVGQHVIWYRGRPCWVRRTRSDHGDLRSLRVREGIAIRMPGFSRQPLLDLIADVKRQTEMPGRQRVFAWGNGYWDVVRRADPRALETIALSDGIKERLVEDFAWFRGSREWYRHRGLSWRRGYLFAGAPGTGKSSLALALAGQFDMPVFALNLGSLANDDVLIEAIGEVPALALLLIEDIDTVRLTGRRDDGGDAASDGAAENTAGGKITLGALLNVLDGAISREGRVLIMTTNHAEQIDPALLRPGRVDLRIDFPRAGPEEIARIFARFFDGRTIEVPKTLSMTPAEVQAICLQYAKDPEAAARRLLRNGVRIVETGAVA